MIVFSNVQLSHTQIMFLLNDSKELGGVQVKYAPEKIETNMLLTNMELFEGFRLTDAVFE